MQGNWEAEEGFTPLWEQYLLISPQADMTPQYNSGL
jgi:hypothetical protein